MAHRKWDWTTASFGIVAGSGRWGIPSGFPLLLPGWVSTFSCGLLEAEPSVEKTTTMARLSGVLCRAECNQSLCGLGLLLAFLSKLPLIRAEIIEELGHHCKEAVAKK